MIGESNKTKRSFEFRNVGLLNLINDIIIIQINTTKMNQKATKQKNK